MSGLSLDAAARHAYGRMAADLRRVFGDRFHALVAGEQGSAAAFVAAVHAQDLDSLSPLVEAWRRDDLDAPLLMTPEEFRRSLDAFPSEYQTLLDHHVVIDGTPPFGDARIHPDDLRRACETQARGHLIHLRQGWIESGAHAHDLAGLLTRSAAPLRQTLANVARLHDEHPADDGALAAFADRVVGMPAELVQAILGLSGAPHRAAGLVSRLPEYLIASERLWAFVDRWRAR